MKKRIGIFPLIFTSFLSACRGPVVVVKPDYNFGNIKSVAILGFEDFPGIAGSGQQVSSIFEKYFLSSNIRLVERRQVEEILKEQKLELTGALDSSETTKIGQILGVDALVLGSITIFTPERRSIVYVDLQNQERRPIYGTRMVAEKQGNKTVYVEQTYIKGYSGESHSERIPEIFSVDAEVGVSVRMVDVASGEILWVGSSTEDALNTGIASELLARRISKALKKVWPPKTP